MPSNAQPRASIAPSTTPRSSGFRALAAEWWDPRGKMAPLHKFNPVRLGYIRDQAAAHFERDPKQARLPVGPAHPRYRLRRRHPVGAAGAARRRRGRRRSGRRPISRSREAHAAQSGLPIDYRCTTAEALADAGERFDIVLAMEVVEHVADVPLFVRRCAEMVKPGGLMIAATLNRTLKSFALAIVGAEYILRWLPRRHPSLGQVRHAERARDRDGAGRACA